MTISTEQEQQLLKLLETVPAINSRLASLEAIVGAIQEIPGATEAEGEIGSFITNRLSALENWAAGIGTIGHNGKFVPPKPASTPAPATADAK